ncbi:MAG: hypothetical protein CMI20_08525 [Opitutae bacterium]|nr:hypothetical protein [Opitutae bacterium]
MFSVNPSISLLIVFSCLLLPSIPTFGKIDFVHQVMPLLKKQCAECHTEGKKKGGLSMNTRAEFLAGGEGGEVAVPGDPEDSYFLELVASEDTDERMPPKGPGLSQAEVEMLHKWVAEGMEWPEEIRLGDSGWEPKLKPRVVSLPGPTNGRTHDIDRILDQDLTRRNIPLPIPATDEILVRRAYLDTIGLLPTPEELDSFLTSDSKTKYEELVDQLLDRDISYADHWMTFWNDLLRNDYTGTGFITKGRTQITSWLYQALRENMSYDQMTRELIDAKKNAAGFINGIKWRGTVNASQTRNMQFAQNVSQVFLGINMKCASCHDSFIDRWTLQEAYDLAAVFAEETLELERCDIPTGKMATPRWMFPELGQIDPKASKKDRLRQLAGLMTHPENGRFTRTIVNRIWAKLMGRGIVHPVDAMHTKPWNEDLLDHLAVRFAQEGYDLKNFIRFVMTSHAYRARSDLLSEEPGTDYVYNGPLPKRMSAEQLMDSIWQVTASNPRNANAKVDRSRTNKKAAPSEVQKFPWPDSITAKWIWTTEQASKINLRKEFILTEKPAATGILATCDNAFTLTINGRLVAHSTIWQKPVKMVQRDLFKAGKNIIEVEAEMFGGSKGFIAQLVMQNEKGVEVIGTGPDWEAKVADQAWAPAHIEKDYGQAPWGKALHNGDIQDGKTGAEPPVRASLVANDFLMRSLGRPHRDQVVTSRPSSLTTLQAIDLANGEILSNTLRKGAKNLSRTEVSDDISVWLYLHALGRTPTKDERKTLLAVSQNSPNLQGLEDLLWMVFMQPDFQIIR